MHDQMSTDSCKFKGLTHKWTHNAIVPQIISKTCKDGPS